MEIIEKVFPWSVTDSSANACLEIVTKPRTFPKSPPFDARTNNAYRPGSTGAEKIKLALTFRLPPFIWVDQV